MLWCVLCVFPLQILTSAVPGALGCSGCVSWAQSHQEGSSPSAPLHLVKVSRLPQAEDDFLERNVSFGGTAPLFDLQEVRSLSCLMALSLWFWGVVLSKNPVQVFSVLH